MLSLALLAKEEVGAGFWSLEVAAVGSPESISALSSLACSFIMRKRPSMLLYVVPVGGQYSWRGGDKEEEDGERDLRHNILRFGGSLAGRWLAGCRTDGRWK